MGKFDVRVNRVQVADEIFKVLLSFCPYHEYVIDESPPDERLEQSVLNGVLFKFFHEKNLRMKVPFDVRVNIVQVAEEIFKVLLSFCPYHEYAIDEPPPDARIEQSVLNDVLFKFSHE